jgi:glycine reductase
MTGAGATEDERREVRFHVFDGRKVIVLGERDGVAGPAIAACVTAGGGEVAYISTQCFV